MKVDFREKRVCVFGLQGSGKSVWSRWFVSLAERAFVYDPMGEYGEIKGVLAFEPQFKHYGPAAVAEIDKVLKMVLRRELIDPLPTLIHVDEANRYCPNRKTLPSMVAYLNDQSRHLGLALGFVARRPVQLATDLVELSHYLVIFRLTGKNDLRYLEDLSSGLSEAVLELEDHEYVLVDQQRNYEIMSPVPEVVSSAGSQSDKTQGSASRLAGPS